MRLTAVAAIVVLVAFAGAAVAQPPAAPAPGQQAPGAPGARGQRLNMEQMLDQLAARISLTDAEKAATKEAIQAKVQAAATLQQELRNLAGVVRKQSATDQELQSALQKFDAALSTYRQKTKDIDAQLVKSLSSRARAALTVVGVIDNGAGARFGGAMGGGMGRRGQGAARRSPGSGASPQ